MCDFEEFYFTCGHSVVKRKSYCHYSRNHPRHECISVKVLRHSWQQQTPCETCLRDMGARQMEQPQSSHQGPSA